MDSVLTVGCTAEVVSEDRCSGNTRLTEKIVLSGGRVSLVFGVLSGSLVWEEVRVGDGVLEEYIRRERET